MTYAYPSNASRGKGGAIYLLYKLWFTFVFAGIYGAAVKLLRTSL